MKKKANLDETLITDKTQHKNIDVEKTMPSHHLRRMDGIFENGDVIVNRYKVISKLGQGGMGIVYKCFDQVAGIEIALKTLPAELSHDSQEMEDIRKNFQLVHGLHHPNIASVNTLEWDKSNGNYYLIMEYVEGEDLRCWLKRQYTAKTMDFRLSLYILHQIAHALDYAHEQNIVHRDIKPGNIMVDASGHVKILDFGLAAQIQSSMTHIPTIPQSPSGTAPYMSPEQWKGKRSDGTADQYALGVVAYEMLGGHLPFESSDIAILQQAVLTLLPDPIKGLPVEINKALQRALSKDPKNRFHSCSDFISALAAKKTEKVRTEETTGKEQERTHTRTHASKNESGKAEKKEKNNRSYSYSYAYTDANLEDEKKESGKARKTGAGTNNRNYSYAYTNANFKDEKKDCYGVKPPPEKTTKTGIIVVVIFVTLLLIIFLWNSCIQPPIEVRFESGPLGGRSLMITNNSKNETLKVYVKVQGKYYSVKIGPRGTEEVGNEGGLTGRIFEEGDKYEIEVDRYPQSISGTIK